MQKWGQCNNIQDAIALDVEPRKLMLWILDRGNSKCSPKIISYSLIYNDVLDMIDLENVPRKKLNTLEIVQRSMDHETRAYIGNAGKHKVHFEKGIRYKTEFFVLGDNIIIVVSLKNLRWWRLHLAEMNHFGLIKADYLAVSKIEPLLFITGKNGTKLFSLDLDTVAEKLDSQMDSEKVISRMKEGLYL